MNKGIERIPHTRLQMIMEAAALLTILLSIGWLLFSWGSLPNEVITHYGFSGQPDKWGNKGSLLLLAGIQVAVYLIITVAAYFPGGWNTGVEVTPENRQKVYSGILGLLCWTKLCVAVIVSFLLIVSAQGKPVGGFFLPISMLCLFGGIVFSFCCMKHS